MDKQHGTNRIEDAIVCCYILIVKGVVKHDIFTMYYAMILRYRNVANNSATLQMKNKHEYQTKTPIPVTEIKVSVSYTEWNVFKIFLSISQYGIERFLKHSEYFRVWVGHF